MRLHGKYLKLRALEPSDIEELSKWENDTETWKISNTLAPFSRFVLEEYIANAHQDIYATKQLRLVIELLPSPPSNEKGGRAIGCIDLFDFDPNHQRAGIGILIGEKGDRRHGYATEALKILMEYCFSTLNLHQLYCNITTDNEPSVLLFQQQGFQVAGIKRQWIRDGNKFKDELILQKIK